MMDEILLHHAELPGDADAALAAAWSGFLPGPRAPRLARMRDPHARLETLLGHALLLGCARAAGWPAPGPWDLQATSAGKLRWHGGPEFSISHAGGCVACALAPRRGDGIGLDIEPRDAVAPGDLRLVATAAELQEYAAAGLTAADLWTAKEAVIKAAGGSLAGIGRVEAAGTAARFDGIDYLLLRPALDADLSCTLATRTPARVSVTRVDVHRTLARLG